MLPVLPDLKVESASPGQAAETAGSIKRQGVFVFPPGWHGSP